MPGEAVSSLVTFTAYLLSSTYLHRRGLTTAHGGNLTTWLMFLTTTSDFSEREGALSAMYRRPFPYSVPFPAL